MKYLVIALILTSLLLGGLLYFQGKHAARQEAEHLDEAHRFQERVSQIQGQLLTEKAATERIRTERVKTDSIFAASISQQRAKTARSERKTAELRPQIDQLADSITVLAQFLDANDSLFAGKAVEIALLTGKIHTDSLSHTSEVKSLENQIDQLQTANVANLERVSDLEKSLYKAQKKANKRLGFGINGGYGIQEHGGTITAGPIISAGIHWTLFRF